MTSFRPLRPSTHTRSLVFSLDEPLPPDIRALMADFRLMVNRGLREASEKRLTARGSLTSFSQELAREYRVNSAHARIATDVSLSLLKGHRRRLRKGLTGKVPYVMRPFLRADDKTFHVDLDKGRIRLSLRNGQWSSFPIPVSDYHRAALADGAVKQLVLTPQRAVLVLERVNQPPYVPESLIALDTNESSLDGVEVSSQGTSPVILRYDEVRRVQFRHFVRRRAISRKKAHDRRVKRRLLAAEGRRESARVGQRLHQLAKGLVETAKAKHAAIALEDLHLPRGGGRGRSFRRRLSSWPQRELHRQLLYKAEARGVPVILVNPRYTSKTCPRCRERKERGSRVGAVFRCESCGWRCDRQLNAGLNIARTALGETPELGGLWLDPDALLKDGRIPLYEPGSCPAAREDRTGSEELRGRT